jgi:hypothetical protein
MAEEKARWARIQQLLGGSAGRSAPPAASPSPGGDMSGGPRSSSAVPALARARADEINRMQPRQAGLTVGGLKRQS